MSGNPVEQESSWRRSSARGMGTDLGARRRRRNQTSLAKSFAVTQGFFSRVMHKDPLRVVAFREAKKQAATYYAERQQDVIDEAPVERDAIAKAREQAGALRWSAKAWDRERFGDPVPGIDVTFNVGQLHLDALRHRAAPQALPEPEPLELPPAADEDDGSGVPA